MQMRLGRAFSRESDPSPLVGGGPILGRERGFGGQFRGGKPSATLRKLPLRSPYMTAFQTNTPSETPAAAEDPNRGMYVATVNENRRLCTDHYLIVMSLYGFPQSNPGQFIQIDCTDPHMSAEHEAPRAFDWSPAKEGAGGGTPEGVGGP